MNITLSKYRRKTSGAFIAAACSLVMTACTTVPASQPIVSKEAVISKATSTQLSLKSLTPPESKVTVAVYGFEDKTGQFRPTETGQTLSLSLIHI